MQHEHQEHMGHDMSSMTHAYSRNLPMNRNGSGTSWLTDNTPMYMYMAHKGRTSFMFHGNVFLRYTSTDFTAKGTRGSTKLDAPNWVMGMGQTAVGKKDCFASAPCSLSTGPSWVAMATRCSSNPAKPGKDSHW